MMAKHWMAVALMMVATAFGPAPASAALCSDGCTVELSAMFELAFGTLGAEAAAGATLVVTDGDDEFVNESPNLGRVEAYPLCAATCQINASTIPGYDPAVAVVEDGSSVFWHSLDSGHLQRETSTPAGSPTACFAESSGIGTDSNVVQFDIVNGGLNATIGGTSKQCLNAVGDPAVGFVLAYHCVLHPTMRGAILVVA